MSPFEAYCTYIAIKTHFSSPSYDYHKYGGKMRLKQETFEKRRDKYFFYKLSKHPDVVNFLVANYVATDNLAWVGKLTGIAKDAERNYQDWVARQQSLSYVFENDIALLKDKFNENFKCDTEQYPYLLVLFNRKKVSLETMVIFQKMINYLPSWRKQIKETTLFPVIDQKITKYAPFMTYDQKIFEEKAKSRFSE